MPPTARFASYAQNGEDVVLWRALGDIESGRYIDVGANHPTLESVSWVFYQRGWHGITVEPIHAYAQLHREQRPRDILVEAAISSSPGESVAMFEIPDTGLSTLVESIRDSHEHAGWQAREVRVTTRRLDDVLTEAGWHGCDIHFMVVDTEGAELDVLRSVDLRVWRPWVLVIEATLPNTTTPTYQEWEGIVLAADYVFCMFDGLSRYYVAREHADLAPCLSYPAGPLDAYTTVVERRLDGEVARLTEDLRRATEEAVRWRTAALTGWTDAVASSREADELRRELLAMRATVSWRVTKPLRLVRERTRRAATNDG